MSTTINTINIPKQRIIWIDVARVIAMLHVMLSHTYTITNIYHKYPALAGGSVLFFFFISGYFSKYTTFKKFSYRILALVAFSITFIVIGDLIAHHGILNVESIIDKIILKKGDEAGLWFIRFLLLATLFIPIFKFLPSLLKYIATITFFALAIYEINIKGIELPQQMPHVAMNMYIALGTFYLGYLFKACFNKTHKSTILTFTSKYPKLLFTAGCVGIIGFHTLGTQNTQSVLPITSGFMMMLFICMFSFGIVSIKPKIGEILAKYGTTAIFVYGIHIPYFRMTTSAHIRFFGNFPSPLFDLVNIIFIFIATAYTYHFAINKNKITNMFLFATPPIR